MPSTIPTMRNAIAQDFLPKGIFLNVFEIRAMLSMKMLLPILNTFFST
jgi:hypothetical protein